jgi:hypothetical protein
MHLCQEQCGYVVGLRSDESQSELDVLSLGSNALKKIFGRLVKCLLCDIHSFADLAPLP